MDSTLTVDQLFKMALQNFQTGNLDKAEQFCRKILNAAPDHADGNHFLGVLIAQQGGESDNAVKFIRKAIGVDPTNAEFHKNLGLIQKNSGKTEGAIASFQKALSLKSDYEEAYNELVQMYKSAGRLDEAIACIKKILSQKPDIFDLYLKLAHFYKSAGKQEEAISSFQKALKLNPGSIEAHMQMGLIFKDMDMMEEAAGCFKNVLSINPDQEEAHNNLGLALQGLDRQEEAVSCFKNAIQINPDYVRAYLNLGYVYYWLGILDKAVSYLRKVLQLQDDYPLAHSGLLLIMNYQPQVTQQEIFADSLSFAQKHTTKEARYFPVTPERRTSERKLKIGYVSPDFSNHSVGYFIKPLLEAHNRELLEIYCYSDVENPDEKTRQIEQVVDHWASIVQKEDEEVIARITEDRIDILVDLAGHTKDNRLSMFAQKPAPIQVSWLGYPNTTGLESMDYRFTDIVADPVGMNDEFYSEKLIRLQDCFLCYQPYEPSPEIKNPPCRHSDAVTFGSFNNSDKINSEVVKVWSKILHGVPNSKLVLKAQKLANKHLKERFLAMFTEEGISSDRIKLKDPVPEIFDHLALYNGIDIALDPFPYNGTTTNCEALWMGVPVVALLGDKHAGRVGASILDAIGMADTLVTDNIDSYIELAIHLAGDRELLVNLRKDLRQRMQTSPLCDATSFAKKIEEAYQIMWADFYGENVKEAKKK